MKMTAEERQLKAVIQSELSRAEGADQEVVQANREAAMRAYYGEPPLDGVSALSTLDVTSTDVADMVNAVLAQLTPMLSTDAMTRFPPNGKDDEEAARAESLAVNHVVMAENKGYIEIQEAVKEALLLRNGCLKVMVDEQEEVRKIPTDGMSGPEIAVLLQPRAPNEVRELVKGSVKVVTTTRKFLFNSVPLDNVCYEANADSSDLQDFRFFAERVYYTRSDLMEMGFKKAKVDALAAITDAQRSTETARNTSYQPSHTAETRDQDTIECFEAYQRIDLDGDGISERYRVLVAAGEVMDYELVDMIPYSVGTAIIRPHRLTGESLYDHLAEVQENKTLFLRQWATNATHLSKGRYFVDPTNTNVDDFMSPDAPVIRQRDMMKAPIPMVLQDIGPSMKMALDYQDKTRTERGGAALDMVSADAQLVGETAYGIERQYSQRELLVTCYATNLAETLLDPIFLIMHHYLRRYSTEPMMLKLAGEWQEVDPRSWPQRKRVDVKAGKSAGERTHIQRTLQQLLNMQISAMQQGYTGQLADLSTVYNTVNDWAMMAGLDSPDTYMLNPKSDDAQQAAQQRQQQMQQQAQAQQQMQQEILNLERMKLAQAAKEAGDELAYKYWSDRLKSETDEAKIVAQGTIDLEKVQLQGEQRETRTLNGAESGATSTGGTTQ